MRPLTARDRVEFHAVAVERDVLRHKVGGRFRRIAHQAARCVLDETRRPRIIGIDAAGIADAKEFALRVAIVLHVLMEVEVILGEVREKADGEVDARDAGRA